MGDAAALMDPEGPALNEMGQRKTKLTHEA